MTISEHRCKYCGHSYYYQGSGEGCLEPTNNEIYCPNCMKVILDALNKSERKENLIIRSPKEINKEILSSELLHDMEQLRLEHKNDNFFPTVGTYVNLDYDNIEIYNIGRYRYYICWNNDNINNKHYFQDYEYCPHKKEYITPYRNLSSKTNSYMTGYCMMRTIKKLNDILNN